MGIRFNTNTWRAPLQLIDCWLPNDPPSRPVPAAAIPRSLQGFVRAGWLKRGPASNDTTVPRAKFARGIARTAAPAHQMQAPPCAKLRPTIGSARSDARLVISGRIGDVCAELERLAALELRTTQ